MTIAWSDATYSPSLTFDSQSLVFTPLQYAGGHYFLAIVRGNGGSWPATMSTDLYVASSSLGPFTKVTLPTISGVPYSPGVARDWVAYDGTSWAILVGGQAGIGAAYQSIHVLHTTDPFGTWTAIEPSTGLTAGPISIAYGSGTWALWAYDGFSQQVVLVESTSLGGSWTTHTAASEVGTGGSVASYANSVVHSGGTWAIAYSENSGGADVNGVRYASAPDGPWTDVPVTFLNPNNVVRHHDNGYWTVQSFDGSSSRIYYSTDITAAGWSYVDSSTIGIPDVSGFEHTGSLWIASGLPSSGVSHVAVCRSAGAPSTTWTLEPTGVTGLSAGQYTHMAVSDNADTFAVATTSGFAAEFALRWAEYTAPLPNVRRPSLRQRQTFIR